ncbi:MAG: hydrogenase maturation peptidase HycI [Candidatus Omnitrophota bacterium]
MSQDNLKKELSEILSGKVVIVGIGNQLKSDDGFGPSLISRIQNKINTVCLDTGLSPENYIGKLIKLNPDVIIFVDAVSMDEPPGTVKLIPHDQIPIYGFSTHNMSPKLMIENIKNQINTEVFMLGVQPKNLEFGENISQEINNALISLESMFVEILGKNEVEKQ